MFAALVHAVPEAAVPTASELSTAAPASTAQTNTAIAINTSEWSKTAIRLALFQALGLSLTFAGGATFWFTGAARPIVGLATGTTLTGLGILGIGTFAQIQALAEPKSAVGEPLLSPIVETRLGLRYVHDPQFAYRTFVASMIDARWDRFRVSPAAWFALDDVNARMRLLMGYRLLRDAGSFLDADAAVSHSRFTSNGFRTSTAELTLGGRLNLERIGAPLAGSFAELATGVGLEALDYDRSEDGDTSGLLLFRAAYGLYIGRARGVRGETKIYYDHRHDDLAGGLLSKGLVSGVFGHFGSETMLVLPSGWGAVVDAEVGAAYVLGASILHRFGETP